MPRMLCLMAIMLYLTGQAVPGFCEQGKLNLQLVRTADEELLWSSPVRAGDAFMISYRHSSDHTPVLDLFRIGNEGEIILTEERFRWYGAGLEFHPDMGSTTFSEGWTRVRVDRVIPRFLLRVGEVAGHVLIIKDRTVPLRSIAGAGESLWIRVRVHDRSP